MIEQIRAARGEVRRAELHPFSQGQTNRQGGAQMAKYLPIYMFSDDTTALEAELEHLLGHPLTEPLELAFDLDLRTPLGKSWDPVLRLLVEELRQPTALTRHPVAARRVEGLVLDALLSVCPVCE